jgi:membrane protein implicated in regulation of membrane protease activity
MAEPVPTSAPNEDGKWRRLVRRLLIEGLSGIGLGMLLVGLGGPAMLSRWYAPPSGDAFSCAGSVESALQQFVWFQAGSALFFALAVVVISYLVRRRFTQRA